MAENGYGRRGMGDDLTGNFLSFIRVKSMKRALQILTSQTKLGVQPEQTEMENMLEQEEIMDFVGTVVQKFDKKN